MWGKVGYACAFCALAIICVAGGLTLGMWIAETFLK